MSDHSKLERRVAERVEAVYQAFVEAGDRGLTDYEISQLLPFSQILSTRARRVLSKSGRVLETEEYRLNMMVRVVA